MVNGLKKDMGGDTNPMQLQFGPITFHFYGLIIGLAVIAAAQVGVRIYRKHKGNEKQFWAAFTWALIFGVIGSRLYHVVDYWEYYSWHWAEIGALWRGGLGIWGAIMGGILGISVYVWIIGEKKIFGKLLDAAAFGAPLGQAIGRWGNYVNQELYGRATRLPWGIQIANKPGKYHPLFLYESILLFGLFGLMLYLEKKQVFKFGRGGYLGGYFIGYGVIRLMLEPLRIHMWRLMGFPTASLVSGLMILVGIILIMRVKKYD